MNRDDIVAKGEKYGLKVVGPLPNTNGSKVRFIVQGNIGDIRIATHADVDAPRILSAVTTASLVSESKGVVEKACARLLAVLNLVESGQPQVLPPVVVGDDPLRP